METKLIEIMNKNDGVLTTKDATAAGIPRVYITKLLRKGIIERVRAGVYLNTESFGDEFYLFQLRYPKAIYSHNTALYFYNMTERTPSRIEITVLRGYNAHRFPENYTVYYITKKKFSLGVTSLISPQGRIVKCTDLERTLCDIIRNNKSLDLETRNKSIKEILRSGKINENKLSSYAKILRCSKQLNIIREIL